MSYVRIFIYLLKIILMTKFFTFLLSFLFFALSFNGLAQKKKMFEGDFWNNVKRSTVRSPWIVGLGWNVIDDDGKPFNKLFDANKSWNVLPYPSKLSCEKDFIAGWSAEFAVNYNQLAKGKTVNGDVLTSNKTFLSADLNGKFSFLNYMKTKTFFDPYVLHGYGYTYRGISANSSVATSNIGLGFNVWVYNDMIGINVQSQAKFALTNPIIKTGANYLQHSLGIVYQFSTGASQYAQKPGRSGSKYKFFKIRGKGKK